MSSLLANRPTATVARVNLLPPEISERRRQRNRAVLTGLVVLLWVLLLGGLYMMKLSDVEAARLQREAAQQEVTRLQAEVAALQEFADLDRKLTARNGLLQTAMANEISWARMLND
ncbi:MAG: hypothetical protein ACRDU8_01235, partial [Egibacteraceae bacterium]